MLNWTRVVVIGQLLMGASASAETFQACVFHYPPVEGKDCDQNSAELGTRFGQMYGLRVIEAICDWQASNEHHWTTRIRYEAAAALPKVSTAEAASAFAFGGTYQSAEDCAATLPGEKALFQSKTGLEPFASYCENPEFEGHPWTLTVMAFGQSSIKPYVTSAHNFGKVLGMTIEQVGEMLANGFRSNGSELVQWIREVSFGFGVVKMRYYGPEGFRIKDLELASMRQPNECLDQKDELVNGLGVWPGAAIGTYCRQFSENEFELISMTRADREVRVVKPTATYPDFEGCMAAKPGVVTNYREALHRDVLAGVCSWNYEAENYTIVLVERPQTN